MMHCRVMMSRLIAVVVLAWLVLSATEAGARILWHGDLASNVFKSDVVVLVERGPPDARGERHELRVREVLHGQGLAVGDTLDLSTEGYTVGWLLKDLGKSPADVDDTLFLFLHQVKDEPGPPQWRIVSGGVRIIVDGKVYRFAQMINPGPYGGVPQGIDPDDVRGDPAAAGPIDVAVFRRELGEAIARAREAKELLAKPPSKARTEALVKFVGPKPVGVRVLVQTRRDSFFHDAVVWSVFEALSKGELYPFLDAVSRDPLSWLTHRDCPHDVNAVVALAARKDVEVAVRHAALRVAFGYSYHRGHDPEIVKKLIALLSDEVPAIRSATASIRFGERMPPQWKRALEQRLKTERHPLVFAQLAHLTETEDLEVPPERPDVVLGFERQNGHIRVMWTHFGERRITFDSELVFEAPGREPHRMPMSRSDWMMQSVWIPKELRGMAGRWRAVVPLSEGEALTVDVHEVEPSPPPVPAPPPPAASPDAGDAGAAPSDPARPRCACDVVGDASPMPHPIAIGAGVLLLALRRRRRRGAHGSEHALSGSSATSPGPR